MHATTRSSRRSARPARPGRRAGVAGIALAAVLLGACGGATPNQAPHAASNGDTTAVIESPTGPGAAGSVAPQPTAIVATITDDAVAAKSEPGAGRVVTTLKRTTPLGSPRVVNVVDRKGDFLEVALPVRPNGSTGWIPAASVRLSPVNVAVDIDRSAKTLTVIRDGKLAHQMQVAVGTGGTPTPLGSFFVTDLIKPAKANGPYGPFAFGLSAHSEVLDSFGGGDGQIGLHGTNDATSIGKDASHGCVRLNNADIATLAAELPLGTPVVVH